MTHWVLQEIACLVKGSGSMQDRPLNVGGVHKMQQLAWPGMCRRKFPLHISQDGSHEETKEVARGFLPRVRYLSHYELAAPIPRQRKENIAYYRIANHYKFIFQTFFDCFNFPRIIILEVVGPSCSLAPSSQQ